MKFRYVVEFNTTNMYVKFQSILQVLLKLWYNTFPNDSNEL